MKSPMQRSLALLREQGYSAERVEHYLMHGRRRKDLFRFCDILALQPPYSILAVQTTTGSHLAEHKKKVLAEHLALLWLRCAGRIQLHGWRKIKGKWAVRVIELTAEDFVQK